MHTHALDIWYTLRRFRTDVLAVLSALVGYWLAWVLVDDPKLLSGVSIGITLVTGCVIIAAEMQGRDFIWLSMLGRGHGDQWIGEDALKYARTESAYRVTNAHSGALLADTLTWADYRMRFDFRIERACLGVILRAVNLGNFVMLQIREDRVRPHIRVQGAWLDWDIPELELANRLTLGEWCHAEILCEKRQVKIELSGAGIGDRTLAWMIPNGPVMFGAGGPETPHPLMMPFAVNFDYGAVGFRNHGTESALVRHLLIEKV